MDEEQKIRYPTIPKHIADYYTGLGYEGCTAAFYCSNSENVLVGVVRKAVLSTLNPHSQPILVQYPDGNVPSLTVGRFFIDGIYSAKIIRAPHSFVGTYLLLTEPVTDMSPQASLHSAQNVRSCASIISLLHGEFVALECHYEAVYNFKPRKIMTPSPPLHIIQAPSHNKIDERVAKLIDGFIDFSLNLNQTITFFVMRAHQERDLSVKYLLLWIALEATLGSGKQRRRFALDVMKSSTLNDILKHLHEKRSDLLHDGSEVPLDHKNYLLIKCVIIIGLLQNNEHRMEMMAFVETELW